MHDLFHSYLKNFPENDSCEENEPTTHFEIEVANDPTFVAHAPQEFNRNVEVKTEDVPDAEKPEEASEYSVDDVREFLRIFHTHEHVVSNVLWLITGFCSFTAVENDSAVETRGSSTDHTSQEPSEESTADDSGKLSTRIFLGQAY